MKLRFESMPNTALTKNMESVQLEKKTTNITVATINIRNGAVLLSDKESTLSVKMIPIAVKQLINNDPVFVIQFDNGENIILQSMDHDLRVGKIGDDGVVYLTPIQDLNEEDTVICYEDEDVYYNDITSIIEVDPSTFKDRETTNIKTDLCNYIISVNKDRGDGVVLNNIIFF